MISLKDSLGLPHYEITQSDCSGSQVTLEARYTGPMSCQHCKGIKLRNKGKVMRRVRHVSGWGRLRIAGSAGPSLAVPGCGKHFCERFPGLLKHQRVTGAFRLKVFQDHWDGINRARAWGNGKRSVAPPSNATASTPAHSRHR